MRVTQTRVFDAIQFTGDNHSEVIDFCRDFIVELSFHKDKTISTYCHCRGGDTVITKGSWILRSRQHEPFVVSNHLIVYNQMSDSYQLSSEF